MRKNYSVSALARGSDPMRLFLLCLAMMVAVGSVMALLTPSAFAETKIAIVDVEKIISQSKAGQSVDTQLTRRREAYQKEFADRENSLMAVQKSLLEEKNTLSPEEFSKRREAYETQLQETRNLFQKRRAALDKGLGNALSELRRTIVKVTAEIADSGGYQVVLTRDSVVIVQSELEITDQVLARMDASLTHIPLSIEE